MTDHFDIIVIGTGPAGSKIASACADEKREVAVVDSRGYGGTCPLRGCIPKKVLTSIADTVEQHDKLQGAGIDGKSNINWKDLIDYKQTFTDSVPDTIESSMQKAGVTTYHGEAMFTGKNELTINNDTITGEKIVIATGAEPVSLPIDGKEHLTDSDAFLELEQLPKRIIFVGGGYISFEFAHVAARAGSEVHILQRGGQALKKFDADLVDMLIKKSEEMGVHVHVNRSVESIEKTKDEYIVHTKHGEKETAFKGDLVVHGAGRKPNVDTLQPNKGDVDYGKNGITVNNYLQSVSNPNVYAAGDAADTDGAPLTPVANIDAHTIIPNLLQGNTEKPDYTGTPSVAFTSPKLAMAGIPADDAAKRDMNIHDTDASAFFTYSHLKEDYAAAKIITDTSDRYIIGAHLIGHEADELINYFAMAIQLNIPIDDLKKVTYTFPTAVSDIPSFL